MALSYDHASTGFLTHIGRLIAASNVYYQLAQDLEGELANILDTYDLGDQDAHVDGLTSTYAGFASEYASRRAALVSYAARRLGDRTTILEELVLPANTGTATILERLITQMITDSETVDASTVTISSVSMNSGNDGNGFILTTKVLDGAQSPGRGPSGSYPSHPKYNGVDSEFCYAEDVRVECTRDSYQDGVTTGEESFLWSVGPSDVFMGVEGEAGGGDNATLTVLNAERIISNGNFEDFSVTNTPDSWDVDNGAVTTNILKETGASNVYRGSSSLKFLGSGAATIQISQTPSTGILKPLTRYLVAVLIKADASIAAGTLTIQFEGTGYTATSPTNEVQTVQISGTPTGGTFTISWDCPYRSTQTTAAIAYNATAATIQAALRLLPGLESVVVANTAGAPPDQTVSVTFHGCVGNVAQLTSTSSMTGGTPVITHATTTAGVEGEKISLGPTALPITWSLRYFWINMPRDVPTDMDLVIEWSGTPTTAKALYIDSLACGPVTYVGGQGVCVVAGSTPWAKNDRGTMTIAQDEAGIINRFMTEAFGVQLPSSTTGAETILDTLAV